MGPVSQAGASGPAHEKEDEKQAVPTRDQPNQSSNATSRAQLSSANTRPSGWSTGICDCCSNRSGACVSTYFCPCMTYADNYVRITGNEQERGSQCRQHCCLCVIAPVLAAARFGGPNRTTLRQKYGLKEDPCDDNFVHTFFLSCALCQEARELDFRQGVSTQHGRPDQKPATQEMSGY